MLLVLIPLLLVLFVALAATTGLALRSRPSRVVARESVLPVAQNWAEARELLAEPETLFQNPQGNDLTLNDLVFYKLALRYPGLAHTTLNDLLNQFRIDHS